MSRHPKELDTKAGRWFQGMHPDAGLAGFLRAPAHTGYVRAKASAVETKLRYCLTSARRRVSAQSPVHHAQRVKGV